MFKNELQDEQDEQEEDVNEEENKNHDENKNEDQIEELEESNKRKLKKLKSNALDVAMTGIVMNETIFPSNVFFEQMVQLKAQMRAIRLLSRDMGLSSTISDLAHGIDNPHSWQRPYIDPLRTQNPSICKPSKYDLQAKKEIINDNNDEIIIDSSPQTIEELVYQNDYKAMKKVINRRRMLKNYVSHCEQSSSSKSNNKKIKTRKLYDTNEYKKSREELQLLELCELQNKLRKDVLNCRMDKLIYDVDNGDNEVLLNPDLFARTAQIGLHFDPHINSANHPPTMATSHEIFPFYYQGRR